MASGPSATQDAADSVRGHRRVVVNDAYRLAPDADILFAHDLSWWARNPGALKFAGQTVCGQEGAVDAQFARIEDETIILGPHHTIQLRNSGLMAIRITVATNPARILLLGFDPELVEPQRYPGLTAGLEALIAEVRAKGIEVERVAAPIVSDGMEPEPADPMIEEESSGAR
jgi:hypothetical protein